MILSQTKVPTATSAVGWVTPENVYADDGALATYAVATYSASQFFTSGYGFSIPTGATIVGISATIQAKVSSTSGGMILRDIRLPFRSIYPTPNVSDNTLTTSLVNRIQGSSTDLWDITNYTAADINDSGFGVNFGATNITPASVTLSVDYVEMTVWYSVPDSNLFFGSNF